MEIFLNVEYFKQYKIIHFPPPYLASRASPEREIKAAATDLVLTYLVPDLGKLSKSHYIHWEYKNWNF